MKGEIKSASNEVHRLSSNVTTQHLKICTDNKTMGIMNELSNDGHGIHDISESVYHII